MVSTRGEVTPWRSISRAPGRRAGRQPEYFTGTVLQDPIIATEAPARLASTRVSFEPGARTAWHSHPLGQTLYVHLRVSARAGQGRAGPGNPPGRRGLDSAGREALARRVADQRHDSHRHAGSARRQLRDLDGEWSRTPSTPRRSAKLLSLHKPLRGPGGAWSTGLRAYVARSDVAGENA